MVRGDFASLLLIKELAYLGFIDYEICKEITHWQVRLNSYDNGHLCHRMTRPDYDHKMVELVTKALVGLDYRRVAAVARGVAESYGSFVYSFSFGLLQKFKQAGWLTILISGSLHEMVEAFARQWGFDMWWGTRFFVKKGKYTACATDIYNYKGQVVEKCIQSQGLTWQRSAGIGDSLRDWQYLKKTTYSFGINPDKFLNLKLRELKQYGIIVCEDDSYFFPYGEKYYKILMKIL